MNNKHLFIETNKYAFIEARDDSWFYGVSDLGTLYGWLYTGSIYFLPNEKLDTLEKQGSGITSIYDIHIRNYFYEE